MNDALPVATLKRLLDADDVAVPGDACQRCGARLGTDHRHVADVETRHLLCVCAHCHASLSEVTEPQGAQRAVPRRYLRLPTPAITDEDWEALEIPVGIAFFFHNSTLGRAVAAYPSPAGAVESLLPPEAWGRVLRVSALTPQADVEALLVRRAGDAHDCFVVPIDACYELTGRIRRQWRGFGGGSAVGDEIDAFFMMLRDKSELATA